MFLFPAVLRCWFVLLASSIFSYYYPLSPSVPCTCCFHGIGLSGVDMVGVVFCAFPPFHLLMAYSLFPLLPPCEIELSLSARYQDLSFCFNLLVRLFSFFSLYLDSCLVQSQEHSQQLLSPGVSVRIPILHLRCLNLRVNAYICAKLICYFLGVLFSAPFFTLYSHFYPPYNLELYEPAYSTLFL